MDPVFIQGRITFYEGLIIVLEEALVALSEETVKSYTINTGQTTESVTKKDISSLTNRLDWAYMMLDYWLLRLNGGATIIARPGF